MLNLCQFIGNLGQDPELRTAQGGTSVCSLSVAVNERRKQGDQWVDHTEWIKVTVWGQQADACGKHLAKGRQVYVQGRMSTRKWQDKNGQDRWTTEIIAEQVRFLGPAPKGGDRDERPSGRGAGNDAGPVGNYSDEIPY